MPFHNGIDYFSQQWPLHYDTQSYDLKWADPIGYCIEMTHEKDISVLNMLHASF